MAEEKNIPLETLERIDAYLLNTMSESERTLFELELKSNSELQKELNLAKHLITTVEVGAMRGTLNQIHNEHFGHQSNVKEKNSNFYFLAIAASFVAILAVGLWLFNKPSSNERLFANHVQYDPGLPVPMSTNHASNAKMEYQFYDAMVDYKNSKFEKAIAKWDELLHLKPENDTLTYFIGSAYFSNEDYSKAIEYFKRIENTPQSAFHSKSQFYLTLCWLQTEDLQSIKELNPDAGSRYFKNIEKIKSALNDKP